MTQQPQSQADALKAMAEGKHGDDSQPHDKHDPHADLDPDAAAALGITISRPASQPPQQDDVETLQPAELSEELNSTLPDASPAPSMAQRRNQMAFQARQQKLAQMHGFKRVMTPMLLVVGGMLILLGIIGLYLVLSYKPNPHAIVEDEGYGTGFKMVVLASLLLGAVLLLGAWMFHRETSAKQ
jgi:hypothetical protein